ncbi:MAG: hypothetical protein AMXMBFR33_40660 [Candidatus Xenobia bacterium]
MGIEIRSMRAEDTETCGAILHSAFSAIATEHGFPPDFPSLDYALQVCAMLAASPHNFSVVAERDGRVVGSNFLQKVDPILAVGPISVAPEGQGRGVGRLLMEAVIEEGRGAPGIRLMQDCFNMASLTLYARLGFSVKEPVALLHGTLEGALPEGFTVRPMVEEDVAACEDLCRRVHGWPRRHRWSLCRRPWPSQSGVQRRCYRRRDTAAGCLSPCLRWAGGRSP